MGKLQQELSQLNEADALRELLRHSEQALVAITPGSAPKLLTDIEDAHQLVVRLKKSGADMRPEQGRLGTLDDRVVRDAGKIVKALGGPAQFAALRAQLNPTSTELRWQLDAILAEGCRLQIRQLLTGLAAVAVVIFAGWLARDFLFPPDPAGDAVNAAQRALQDSNSTQAITEINTGLTIVPTSTQLLLWKGALLQLQEDSASTTAAEASFDEARKLLPEKDFLLERSQVYLLLGQYKRTVGDMDTLIARVPESAEGYYMRGGAYEALGEKANALDDINKAASLAEAQGNDALFATAKVRMGMLMQSP